jgi:hypothetical protein
MAPEPAGSGAPVGFYRHRIVASPGDFSILVEIFCARAARNKIAPRSGAKRRRRRRLAARSAAVGGKLRRVD